MTERIGLDRDRIWVSVHAGDPQLRLGQDEVAIEQWHAVGMPRERIVPLPSSENFWSVGGPGPCGPDSEIYWDWGEEPGCGEPDCKPGCTRCERFLEFWNLVFMEYELASGRHADAAAEAEHRHGPWARADGADPAGRRRPSTTPTATRRSWSWIADESGVALRRHGRRDEGAPGARRPRPRDELPRRGRRDAVERGRAATCCAASSAAPCSTARAIGLAAPFLAGLADVVIEQMGGAYPELAREPRGDPPRRSARRRSGSPRRSRAA